MLLIGIDPGVNTGVSGWDSDKSDFSFIYTLSIHEAILFVLSVTEKTKIYIEDARQRKWFGNSGREQLQGAGSIKRDCSIWEDFLVDYGINHVMIPPKSNMTKLDSKSFQKMTGWKERTSQHARDASMLVFKRSS